MSWRSACVSHLLSPRRRCYVVLGAIVAVLSLLAAFQSPVQINTHANSTSITKAGRSMSCTCLSDLCALLQTRLCEGRRALLCLLLLSSSQETRLFKQLLQQLIISLNTHKHLLLLRSQMREEYNSVCVCLLSPVLWWDLHIELAQFHPTPSVTAHSKLDTLKTHKRTVRFCTLSL